MSGREEDERRDRDAAHLPAQQPGVTRAQDEEERRRDGEDGAGFPEEEAAVVLLQELERRGGEEVHQAVRAELGVERGLGLRDHVLGTGREPGEHEHGSEAEHTRPRPAHALEVEEARATEIQGREQDDAQRDDARRSPLVSVRS